MWTNRQTYVVCSGNEGPAGQSIRAPGVAKNALTVGNVWDNGYLSVGVIDNGEQPGPDRGWPHEAECRGSRHRVTSAKAGTTDQYTP